MTRLLPMFLLASVGAGCTFTPPGECQTAADCFLGARCETGVCVMGCDADEHCAGDWERCEPSTRRCAVRDGRCSSQTQCETWEVCGDGHTCEIAPSFCAAETDCADHEDCNLSTHLCQLQAGRCNSPEDCGNGPAPWASCDSQHFCTYSAADDVMMWGTLSEGSCARDAISPVEFPEQAQVGFGCYTGILDSQHAVLTPSEEIVYFESDTDRVLRIFTPDRFEWDEGLEYWMYPADPYSNDAIVPTPGCGAGYPSSVLVQADTSRILYRCASADTGWYDTSGNLLVTSSSNGDVLAWNRDGLFLRGWSELEVVNAAGAVTGVTGLPAAFDLLDARADGSGFWLALNDNFEGPLARWRIDAQGVASRQVEYAELPNGVSTYLDAVLSRSGALYSQIQGEDFNDLVVRHPEDGATSTIVYREWDKPLEANDTSQATLQLYNLLHISYLFAGP